MMLVPQKKNFGGGAWSISVGVNVHQGGSAFLFCSSSVVSGFGILLLGGGCRVHRWLLRLDKGPGYPAVSVGSSSGIWWSASSWQLAWASGSWLHPGSSVPSGSSPSGLGHLAAGSILAAFHLVLGICWQLSIWSWASGSWLHPGSSPSGPGHLADIW